MLANTRASALVFGDEATSSRQNDATGLSAIINLVPYFSENVTDAKGVIELRMTNGGPLVEQFDVTTRDDSQGGNSALSGSTTTPWRLGL